MRVLVKSKNVTVDVPDDFSEDEIKALNNLDFQAEEGSQPGESAPIQDNPSAGEVRPDNKSFTGNKEAARAGLAGMAAAIPSFYDDHIRPILEDIGVSHDVLYPTASPNMDRWQRRERDRVTSEKPISDEMRQAAQENQEGPAPKSFAPTDYEIENGPQYTSPLGFSDSEYEELLKEKADVPYTPTLDGFGELYVTSESESEVAREGRIAGRGLAKELRNSAEVLLAGPAGIASSAMTREQVTPEERKNIGYAATDTIDAFASRFFGSASFGLYRPGEELQKVQALHPVAAAGGTIAGDLVSLVASGGAMKAAGISEKAYEAAVKLTPKLGKAMRFLPPVIMSGTTFATQTALSEMVEQAYSNDIDVLKLGRETIVSGGLGSVLGGISATKSVRVAVASASGLGYLVGYSESGDHKQATITATIWGLFELVGGMGRNERLNMNAIRHLEDSLTEYAEGQALKAPGLVSKEKLESIRENIRAGVSAWMEQGAAKFGGLKEMVKSKGKTLEFFEWMNQAVRQKIAGKTYSAKPEAQAGAKPSAAKPEPKEDVLTPGVAQEAFDKVKQNAVDLGDRVVALRKQADEYIAKHKGTRGAVKYLHDLKQKSNLGKLVVDIAELRKRISDNPGDLEAHKELSSSMQNFERLEKEALDLMGKPPVASKRSPRLKTVEGEVIDELEGLALVRDGLGTYHVVEKKTDISPETKLRGAESYAAGIKLLAKYARYKGEKLKEYLASKQVEADKDFDAEKRLEEATKEAQETEAALKKAIKAPEKAFLGRKLAALVKEIEHISKNGTPYIINAGKPDKEGIDDGVDQIPVDLEVGPSEKPAYDLKAKDGEGSVAVSEVEQGKWRFSIDYSIGGEVDTLSSDAVFQDEASALSEGKLALADKLKAAGAKEGLQKVKEGIEKEEGPENWLFKFDQERIPTDGTELEGLIKEVEDKVAGRGAYAVSFSDAEYFAGSRDKLSEVLENHFEVDEESGAVSFNDKDGGFLGVRAIRPDEKRALKKVKGAAKVIKTKKAKVKPNPGDYEKIRSRELKKGMQVYVVSSGEKGFDVVRTGRVGAILKSDGEGGNKVQVLGEDGKGVWHTSSMMYRKKAEAAQVSSKSVADEQIWEAAKDIYETRKALIQRYKDKRETIRESGEEYGAQSAEIVKRGKGYAIRTGPNEFVVGGDDFFGGPGMFPTFRAALEFSAQKGLHIINAPQVQGELFAGESRRPVEFGEKTIPEQSGKNELLESAAEAAQGDLLDATTGLVSKIKSDAADYISTEIETRGPGYSYRYAKGSSQARAKAQEFVGKPIKNNDSGIAATVSNESLGKMLTSSEMKKSVSPQAHAWAVANIDRIFEDSIYRGSRKEAKDPKNIKSIHHFAGAMSFEGKPYFVRIMTKEFNVEGVRIYLSRVGGEEKPPASIGGHHASPELPASQVYVPPAGDFEKKIAVLMSKVKAGIESAKTSESMSEVGISYGAPENLASAIDLLARQTEFELMAEGLSAERKAIIEKARELKYFDLRGVKVSGPADIAAAWKVYRNPAMELAHFIVVKDGAVFAHHATTSGMVNAAHITQEFSAIAAKDLASAGEGAELYFFHNHPSGRIDQSLEDFVIHKKLRSGFGEKFKGGIVINDGKFSLWTSDDAITEGTYKKDARQNWHAKRFAQLRQPEQIAEYFDATIRSDKHNSVVFFDDSLYAVGLDYIDPTLTIAETVARIKQQMRDYAASKYAIIGDRETLLKFVRTPGYSFEEKVNKLPYGIVDAIEVDPKSGTWVSYEKDGVRGVHSGDRLAELAARATAKGVDIRTLFSSEEGYGTKRKRKKREPLQPGGIGPIPHNLEDFEGVKIDGNVRGYLSISKMSQALVRKYAERIGEAKLTQGLKHGRSKPLGLYDPESENILVRAMSNISTVVHEITHHISFSMGLRNKIARVEGYSESGNPIYSRETADVQKALTEAYVEMYPRAKADHPLSKRIEEGIAVFIQSMAVRPEVTKAAFPILVEKFLDPTGEFYNPQWSEMVADVRAFVHEYAKLDPLSKTGARMAHEEMPTPKKRIFNGADRARYELLDDIYPFQKMAALSNKSETPRDASLWLRVYRNVPMIASKNIFGDKGHWSFVGNELKRVHDFNWKTLMDSLKNKGNQRRFDEWLANRRTHYAFIELDRLTVEAEKAREQIHALIKVAQEAGLGPREMMTGSGETIADEIEALKKKIEERDHLAQVLENDGFKRELASMGYEQNRGDFVEEERMFDELVASDLDMLRSAGLISHENYVTWRGRKGYATFKRFMYNEISGEEKAVAQKGRGGKNASNMKARHGSRRDVLPPTSESVKNHVEIMKKATGQIIKNAIVGMADSFPELFVDAPIVRVPRPDGGFDYPQDKDPSIIIRMENGKRSKAVVVDAEIREILNEVLTPHNLHAVQKVLVVASRLFTKGTTGWYLPFAFSNFAVDQFTATAQSLHDYTPVMDAIKVVRGAMLKSNTKDAAYLEEYLQLGGERQTLIHFWDMSPDEFYKSVQGEVSGLNKLLERVEQGLDWLSTPISYSEILTRAAEYIKARKAGVYQLAALERAGNITVPFHHIGHLGGGNFAKSWVRSIPYLNASVQAVVKYADALLNEKTRKKALFVMAVVTGAMLAGFASVLAFASKKQRENYLSLMPEDLSKYIYLPNPFSNTELLRIRIPEQMGVVGSLVNMALAQMMMDANYTTGDYTLPSMAGAAGLPWSKGGDVIDTATAWIPAQLKVYEFANWLWSWVPQLMKPATEVLFGHKSYPKVMPIESQALQNDVPKARYTSRTSEAAKFIAEIASEFPITENLSPVKIDYLLEHYLGRSIKVATKLELNNPFVRSLMFTAGRRIQQFYDLKEKYEQHKKSYRSGKISLSKEEKASWNKVGPIIEGVDRGLKYYSKLDKALANTEDKAEREKLEARMEELSSKILERLNRIS